MGGAGHGQEGGAESTKYLPGERAVLYETKKHTKRKVGDFSRLLTGLKSAAQIPELFENVNIESPLLSKIVKSTDEGGCFPEDLTSRLDWFFDNVDLKRAARGEFEPIRGMNYGYDEACDVIKDVKRSLESFQEEMCSSHLQPRSLARSSWKYVNLKEDSK